MGRPTKLDDLTSKRIVDAVAKGLPLDTVAKLARIAPSTLFDWMARGREGEVPFAEFSERVKEAEAKGEQELVDRIRNASMMPERWQAAAWLLERRRPEAYARRDGVIENDRGAASVDLTPEQVQSLADAMRSKKVV